MQIKIFDSCVKAGKILIEFGGGGAVLILWPMLDRSAVAVIFHDGVEPLGVMPCRPPMQGAELDIYARRIASAAVQCVKNMEVSRNV